MDDLMRYLHAGSLVLALICACVIVTALLIRALGHLTGSSARPVRTTVTRNYAYEWAPGVIKWSLRLGLSGVLLTLLTLPWQSLPR